ncbi:unnamed protein product [Victoria cruziana]
MENLVGVVVIGMHLTDDADDRQVLTVSSGDGVKYVEPTNGERGSTCADTLRPSITIHGVPSIELNLTADEVEPWFDDYVVKKGDVEITRNKEDIGDVNLNEMSAEVVSKGSIKGDKDVS